MCKADGTPTAEHRSTVLSRASSMAGPIAGSWVLTLIALGCGSGTEPNTRAVTTLPTLQATTTATLPATTTSTIDFDQPPDQQTTPLPDDATVPEIAELIEDVRGPSDDVTKQMNRLVDFPQVPSPLGAQIIDLSISVETAPDGGYRAVSAVSYLAPQGASALVGFIEDELRARGWNKANTSRADLDGVTESNLVFRIPGTPGDDTELGVTIAGIPGATRIELEYRTLIGEQAADPPEVFRRLQAWQGALRTPSTAEAVAARIRTDDHTGNLAVSYRMPADTAAEARESIVDLVRDEEFSFVTSSESGATAPPLLLVDEDGRQLRLEFTLTRDPEIIEMVVSNAFELEPVP